MPVALSNVPADAPPWAVLDHALGTLQYELLTEHASAMAGVAPTQDEVGAMTGLHVTLPHGSQLDVDEAVGTSVASLPPEYADAVASAAVEIGESELPVTFADLCRAMQRLMDESTRGGDLTFVGIDTATGRLSVGSLGAPEPLIDEVRVSLHGALDVVPDTRQVPAVPAVTESEG